MFEGLTATTTREHLIAAAFYDATDCAPYRIIVVDEQHFCVGVQSPYVDRSVRSGIDGSCCACHPT